IPNNVSVIFFFSSRRRHTRFSRDWSSDVCSSDLLYLFRSLSNKIHREVGAHLSKYHEESAEHFDYLHTVESYEQRWIQDQGIERSEERRVGKEYRTRWAREISRKNWGVT